MSGEWTKAVIYGISRGSVYSPLTTHHSPFTPLRIQSIEAVAVEIPLRKNFGGSTYTILKRCTAVTCLRTDEGLASEVYNGDNRSHGREIARLIHEELAPRVKGMDILEVERAWQAMWANHPPIRNGYMEVSKAPGFGIQLDAALVRKYRII